MVRWIIRNRLAAFEARYGYDLGYARELLAVDRRAFFAYARLTALSSYRRDVPRDAYFAAKLVGALTEDCGPCTQLVVAMALEAGVAAGTIAAVKWPDASTLQTVYWSAAPFCHATRKPPEVATAPMGCQAPNLHAVTVLPNWVSVTLAPPGPSVY